MINQDTRYCPACSADWQGVPIPEKYRQHYGTHTHYSRLIGVEVQGKGDRIDH